MHLASPDQLPFYLDKMKFWTARYVQDVRYVQDASYVQDACAGAHLNIKGAVNRELNCSFLLYLI